MDNIGKLINDFYTKKLFDDYGGSVFMTILIIGIFSSLIRITIL